MCNILEHFTHFLKFPTFRAEFSSCRRSLQITYTADLYIYISGIHLLIQSTKLLTDIWFTFVYASICQRLQGANPNTRVWATKDSQRWGVAAYWETRITTWLAKLLIQISKPINFSGINNLQIIAFGVSSR